MNPATRRERRLAPRLSLVLSAGCLLAGCSAEFFRQQADDECYGIIQARQESLLGRTEPFDIEPPRPLDEELSRRRPADRPPPASRPDEDAPAPAGRAARPVILAAGPCLGADTPQLASLLVARRSADPPIGQLVDGDPPATSQPAGSQTVTQPGTAPAGPVNGATQPAETPVQLAPISGGERLFIEPGNWPADVSAIDLVAALRVAAVNSRQFQAGKESVYRAALALTGARYAFESQFFGTVDSTLAQPSQDTRTGTAVSSLGVNRAFTTGGTMALNVTNTLFEVFTDPTGKRASSALSLAVSQPLLRGAGYKVVAEPLIQADRDVTYALRTFERLKRQLAVSVAAQFYEVLRLGDQVINERNNYVMLVRARQRTEELARAMRLPAFQVDQAHQDELRARNRWVQAVGRYNQSVDEFRRLLGVPTEWPIVPDPRSLARLARDGLAGPVPTEDQAIATALANRLDLATVRDRVDDAGRRVVVAADALKMGLKLSAAANVPTHEELNRPTDFRFEHGRYSVGVLLDLPLDRLRERNAYRASLIDQAQSQRALTDQIDQVAQQIRQELRNLIRARNTFQIQESALRLAERRVESTNLLLQAGRASTRDLLEAQAALLEAQNAVTAAVVDYHVARLELLRDMETLQVEPAGLTYHDTTTQR